MRDGFEMRQAHQDVLVPQDLAGSLRATWQQLQDLTGDGAFNVSRIVFCEFMPAYHTSHDYIPAGFARTIAVPTVALITAYRSASQQWSFTLRGLSSPFSWALASHT